MGRRKKEAFSILTAAFNPVIFSTTSALQNFTSGDVLWRYVQPLPHFFSSSSHKNKLKHQSNGNIQLTNNSVEQMFQTLFQIILMTGKAISKWLSWTVLSVWDADTGYRKASYRFCFGEKHSYTNAFHETQFVVMYDLLPRVFDQIY